MRDRSKRISSTKPSATRSDLGSVGTYTGRDLWDSERLVITGRDLRIATAGFEGVRQASVDGGAWDLRGSKSACTDTRENGGQPT
jgi:hypothetical protein